MIVFRVILRETTPRAAGCGFLVTFKKATGNPKTPTPLFATIAFSGNRGVEKKHTKNIQKKRHLRAVTKFSSGITKLNSPKA